ncbi:MAG: hypothetical protein AB7I36_16505 [Rhodospirillaceae bacterium]
MSNGEMAYLALVLIVYAAFMGTLGFVSIWSRRPGRASAAANQSSPAAGAALGSAAPRAA